MLNLNRKHLEENNAEKETNEEGNISKTKSIKATLEEIILKNANLKRNSLNRIILKNNIC